MKKEYTVKKNHEWVLLKNDDIIYSHKKMSKVLKHAEKYDVDEVIISKLHWSHFIHWDHWHMEGN